MNVEANRADAPSRLSTVRSAADAGIVAYALFHLFTSCSAPTSR